MCGYRCFWDLVGFAAEIYIEHCKGVILFLSKLTFETSISPNLPPMIIYPKYNIELAKIKFLMAFYWIKSYKK